MPTYRKLYTKIVDSFDFAEMPDDLTRLIWMLMIVVVDSQGRGIDSPSWLNSRMFPLAPRDLKDIENSMTWLNQREMIRRYSIGRRNYFDVPTFHDYQTGTDKEAASVIPPYPLLQSNSRVTPETVKSRSTPLTDTDTESLTDSEAITKTDTKPPVLSLQINPDLGALAREYESNFGIITPGVTDFLADDLEQYGLQLCFDAMAESLRNNVRKWSYVQGILKNWHRDGRGPRKSGKDKTPAPPGVAYFEVGNERLYYQDGVLIRTEVLNES